jgi:3'-phosphoadenosine 5'-phosphosulfate sulfotransferase (PAPS reductase)/FAD synthetase
MLTTSGGETSAAMPHLAASAIGKDFPLVFVDHGYYTSSTYRMIDYFRESGFDLRVYRSLLMPGEVERNYHGWSDPRSALFSTVVRAIKHAPLNRAFEELTPKAWLRGIMRHETPERQAADFVQLKIGRLSGSSHPRLEPRRHTALPRATRFACQRGSLGRNQRPRPTRRVPNRRLLWYTGNDRTAVTPMAMTEKV